MGEVIRNVGADPGFPLGVPTLGAGKHTILPNLKKNCMKLRKSGGAPLDPPVQCNIVNHPWHKYCFSVANDILSKINLMSDTGD